MVPLAKCVHPGKTPGAPVLVCESCGCEKVVQRCYAEKYWRGDKSYRCPGCSKNEMSVSEDGATIQINLFGGGFCLIDAGDAEQVLPFKWVASHERGRDYAVARVKGAGRNIRMHHLLCGEEVMDVDHINRNGLDNRRSNLRVASRSENLCNRGKCRNNTSGFKGVSFHPCGKWVAHITRGYKAFHLGLFDSPVKAALAYDAEALRLHGRFARTNQSLGLLPEKDVA